MYLETSRQSEVAKMSAVKISSKIDEKVWEELKSLAGEMHQNVSGLLTEAVKEYLQRRRVRPVVKSARGVVISDRCGSSG